MPEASQIRRGSDRPSSGAGSNGAGTGAEPHPGSRGPDGAARWALLSLFLVNGLALGAWISRIPAIRESLAVTPSQLGLILLAGNLAGLPVMIIAPRVVARFGQPIAIRTSGVLFGSGYVVMGVATAVGSPPLFASGLLLHGTAWALYGFTSDFASTIVERRMGRPIIAQFHGGFGVGMVLGSLAGAAAAARGISLVAWFAGLAVLAVLWRLVAAHWLLNDDAAVAPPPLRFRKRARSGEAAATPGAGYTLTDAWRDPRALLVGVIMLAAVTSELTAADWVALAMVDGRGVEDSVAALTLTGLVLALTLIRLASTPILNSLGRVRTIRLGAVLAISGIVLFVFAPTVPLAVAGAAAWGAGTALNIPIAVSASSDDPSRTANRLVVMSVFGLVPLLVVPAGIGALGDQVGVRYAVLAVAAVLAWIVVIAGRIAPEPVAGSPADLEDADGAVEPSPPAGIGGPGRDQHLGIADPDDPAPR